MTTTIAPVQFKIIDGPGLDAIFKKFKDDLMGVPNYHCYFVCIREDDESRNIGSEPVVLSNPVKKYQLVPDRIRGVEKNLVSLEIKMDVGLGKSGYYKTISITYSPLTSVHLKINGKMTRKGTFHLEHFEASVLLE